MSDGWKQDRIGSALAGTNPTVLARLTQAFAVIGDAQFLPGYCVLLVDDPTVGCLTDLPKARRLEFLESMESSARRSRTPAARSILPSAG